MDNIEPVKILDQSWIENLAMDEINMEESGVVHFNDHLNPNYILEESSIELMDRLKDLFEINVAKFNELRGDLHSGSQIKIFKISNTVNDFMLYRNSLKLVVSRKSCDCIVLGFLSSSGKMYSARLNQHEENGTTPHEIRAHLAPFNEIIWQFQNEKVNLINLSKHYLTEFIKNSAR